MTDLKPITASWERDWARNAMLVMTGILVVTVFMAPRFTAFAGILLIGASALRATAADWPQARIDDPAVLLAGLGVFAMLSAFWAPAPAGALTKGAILAGLALGTSLAVSVTGTMEQKLLRRGLAMIGVAIVAGTVIVAVEILTDQWLYRVLVSIVAQYFEFQSKHIQFEGGVAVHAGEGEINRRTTVAVALLLPGLLLIRTITSPAPRLLLLVLQTGAGAIILAAAWHQSSQAALIAGAVTLALASVALTWTRRFLVVSWIVAVVLIVPFVLGAFRADLHRANWLFYTARHRIVIWDFMATRVLESPLLGIGVEGARVRHETVDRKALLAHQESQGVGVSTAPHAHNFYLQVWYELGAVGALLSLLAGLSLLRRLSDWPPGPQRWALAQFALIATLIASSYGLWQSWLQVLIALSAILTVAGLRPNTPPASPSGGTTALLSATR